MTQKDQSSDVVVSVDAGRRTVKSPIFLDGRFHTVLIAKITGP